ncbi:MAG: regulatory protein RecX [Candidatus Methanospirareceae archaeon]
MWQMVDNDLRLYGYDPQERDRIVEASKFMPTLSDLLQWMAKEAFEDDMARELGLDEEFPEKFKEYCRRLGIPEEDALRYWRAHWSSASWTQMAEAFHRERAEAYPRGMHDVVEQEWQRKWDIFYRQVEMPKFYRDLLTKITYSVITRVDARRMYEMGFLTEEELTAIFIANGYRKEDAERMTQWVKTEVQRYAEEDLRGLTRANVDKLYRLGLINDDQYVDLLTKIGVGRDTAEYYLELLKHDIFRELYEARINAIKRKYQKRIITRDEAYKSLVDMGIDAEQAGIYLDAWEEGLVEETRKLTKEDVIKAWKARIFDGSKAYQKLREIGYSHDDAITLLRINGMSIEEVRGLEAELRWG